MRISTSHALFSWVVDTTPGGNIAIRISMLKIKVKRMLTWKARRKV
jgi:hypothetical protein